MVIEGPKNVFGFLRHNLLCLLILISTSGYCIGSKSNDTIILETLESTSIGKRVWLFEDKSTDLTIEQIIKLKPYFKKSKVEVPAFGSTKSAIWLYFNAKNQSDLEWFIEFGSSYVEEIDFYKIDANGICHSHFRLKDKFKNRIIQSNRIVLPLSLTTATESIFYMRVSSNTIIKLPLTISSIQNLYEESHFDDTIYGIYFGLVLGLILYNLFVYYFFKDVAYIYYAVYVILISLNVAYVKGYSLEFLLPEEPQLNHINYFVGLSLIFTMLFTEAFLSINQYAPKVKWIYGAFCLITLGCCAGTFIGYDLIAFELMMAMVILLTPVVLGVAAYTLKKGFTPARFYFVAFILSATGAIVYILKDQDILPINAFTENSLAIGSALEAIILSFALADKLNVYKKEIEEAKSMAIDRAGEFSKQLIQSQESERKKIAGDLYQSIGQSLGVVKTKLQMAQRGILKEKQISEINETVAEAINEVRTISYNLCPLQLEILGLTQYLKSLIDDITENHSIDIAVEIQPVDDLFLKEVEIIIFRILQEGLNNMVEHYAIHFGKVTVSTNATYFILSILMNGKKTDNMSDRFVSIKERTNIINGNFLCHESGLEIEIVIEIPFSGNVEDNQF